METLWKSEAFTTDDFRAFKYQNDPAEGIIDNIPQCTAFHTNTTLVVSLVPPVGIVNNLSRERMKRRDGFQLSIFGRRLN